MKRLRIVDVIQMPPTDPALPKRRERENKKKSHLEKGEDNRYSEIHKILQLHHEANAGPSVGAT